ncbi:MAG TPA: primosomal protein N' [Firmicutes bacterium]|nr:primosomal protein N' [Bacillota bacterium]
MDELYAQVILDIISDALDRPYQYSVPPHLREKVQPGCRVLVPFRSSKVSAIVVSLGQEKGVHVLRDILAAPEPDPVLTPEMLQLSDWLAGYFYDRRIEAIRLCLPPLSQLEASSTAGAIFEDYVLPQVERSVLLAESLRLSKRALRQSLLLGCLAQAVPEGLPWGELRRKTGASKDSLHALAGRGLVRLCSMPRERLPLATPLRDSETLLFTREQAEVWQEISSSLAGQRCPILLHGITGSGKTEIYYHTAAAVLNQGKTALILVPEIALTPQLIAAFRGRFTGCFALLHSSLSPGERSDQWWRVKKGEAQVVLGARSAVFAPLENIGLIVLDEEHEHTYRQGDGPRYHARDVARWRAEYHGAQLLLGSATPSLETYQEARKGRIKLLELKERVGGRPLPAVQVVDMRQEFQRGNRKIFSRLLIRAIQETLFRKEQLILFLNRRGFAGFQLCRSCGYVMQCPSCSVSLTYHTDPEHLQCHFCGYRCLPEASCPGCSSIYLRHFGLGTQRVEKAVRQIFPQANILRMDSDATKVKDAHRKIWEAFQQGDASVLIGTQMIAKGLDFPNVTLVGVIAADITLNLPDFRAGERTFQLLTQVAGRAGRGDKKGEVIIQTYNPEHYSIRKAAAHNYDAFMQEELRRREDLAYPPFGELLLFTCSALVESTAAAGALELRSRLEQRVSLEEGEEILGPAPAPLKKIRDYYRFHLLLKGKSLEKKSGMIRIIVWELRAKLKDTRITVDFNPLMML